MDRRPEISYKRARSFQKYGLCFKVPQNSNSFLNRSELGGKRRSILVGSELRPKEVKVQGSCIAKNGASWWECCEATFMKTFLHIYFRGGVFIISKKKNNNNRASTGPGSKKNQDFQE